jgi:hypothetical protein
VYEEQSEPRNRPPSPRSVRAKTASFAYGSVSGRPPLAEIVTSSRFPANASARFEAKALRKLKHPHRSGSLRSFAEGRHTRDAGSCEAPSGCTTENAQSFERLNDFDMAQGWAGCGVLRLVLNGSIATKFVTRARAATAAEPRKYR